MIGLRDRYTTRSAGEAWLLAGDAIAASFAILFVTGALDGATPLIDLFVIALWSVLPRGLGRVLDSMLLQPRGLPRSVMIAAAIGATFVALVTIGLTLIQESAALGVSQYARPWLILMILVAWGTGFLLFLPRVYLLHDLFLSGLIALALSIGREGGMIAVPCFFLGLALSAAVRHQILDVFAEIPRPRVNVVNARRLSLRIGLLITVGFIGGNLLATHLFPRVGIVPEYAEPSLLPAELGDYESGGVSRIIIAGEDQDGERAAGATSGAQNPPGSSTGSSSDEAQARIGFTRKIQLGTLSGPQADPRVVLVAREIDAAGEQVLKATLRPDALWRGLTLSTFDPLAESWAEEPMLARERSWPSSPLERPRESWHEGTPSIIDIAVITPTMPTLPSPYFPVWLSPPTIQTASYRENVAGDVFPTGGVPERARYAMWVLPRDDSALPLHNVYGRHTNTVYNQVPAADDLGFDVGEYVFPIFQGAQSIQERVARLEAHFRESFSYDNDYYWVPVTGRLREFCLRNRVGNCEYFATAAAVLLRAGGVSTRVVAGFLGYEWDAENSRYIVRNGSAHLWTEVYYPGYGWFPIDATAWVPLYEADSAPDVAGNPAPVPGVAQPPRRGNRSGGSGSRSTAERREDGSRDISLAGRPSNREEPDPRGAIPPDPFELPSQDGSARPPAESLHSWIEVVEPPPAREQKSERESDQERTADRQNPNLRRNGESQRQYEARRLKRTRQGHARIAVLAIGIGILFLVALQFLRPRRLAEDEEGAELESEDHALGGIPDPLAGLTRLPEDFVARTHNDRVIYAYHRLQKDLSQRRRHRRPPETPREHGGRSATRFPEVEEDFTRLVGVVYAALYGAGEVGEESAIEAEKLCDKLRTELR